MTKHVASLGVIASVALLAAFETPSDAGGDPDGDALYELVKAAQARNLEAAVYDEGRIAFDVDYHPPDDSPTGRKGPVRAHGRVVWKGDDHALWTYRARDPDEHTFSRWSRAESDDAAVQRYTMIAGEKLYGYNPKHNKVYVTKVDKSSFAASPMLQVMPRTHWFRCCPPINHVNGRPWIEKIGPTSPVMRPGATISIERDGDLVRQVRTLANGSTSTTTFSLEWDGNVVEHRFFDRSRDTLAKLIRYEWGRAPSGVCVLKRCEAKEFEPGSETEVRQSYTLVIESIDLERPVSSAEVSPAALLSMLPKDVFIVDDVAGKNYYASRDVKPPQPRFDRLAEVVATEGFLSEED